MQLGLVRDEIEPALRRHFLAFFRNETDFIRHNAQREVDDLGGVSHLEIEFRHERFAQSFDIAILNVSPIRAQMRGDPVRTGAFTDARDRDRIRLAVFRFRHRRITRLPQRGDMIDVYAESKCSHCFNCFCHVERSRSCRAVMKRRRETSRPFNNVRFLDFARNDKRRATEVDRALRRSMPTWRPRRTHNNVRGGTCSTSRAERPVHLAFAWKRQKRMAMPPRMR